MVMIHDAASGPPALSTDYFGDVDNEKYIVHACPDTVDGQYWVYICNLLTGDPDLPSAVVTLSEAKLLAFANDIIEHFLDDFRVLASIIFFEVQDIIEKR